MIDLRRLGKRIVFGLEDDLFIVLHLMIAGRLRWRERGAAIPGKVGLAAFDFPHGTADPDRGRIEAPGVDPHRARRRRRCSALDPRGLEVLDADLAAFADG